MTIRLRHVATLQLMVRDNDKEVSMSRIKLQPPELACASGMDCANRQMRKDQRERWTREDYNMAVAEYHRLNPCPDDVTCELCNGEPKVHAAGGRVLQVAVGDEIPEDSDPDNRRIIGRQKIGRSTHSGYSHI